MTTNRKQKIRFKDRMIKAISKDGYFRIAGVKTTDVVRAAQERHNLSLLSTVLLGRTLTASMLLASELKGEERLRLKLEGNGPQEMLVAEANRAGEIRGFTSSPNAQLDMSDGSPSLEEGLGVGLLTVSKTLYNEAEPRYSTIELHRGDVTSDVAFYLTQSEQIPSGILLDVKLDDNGQVSQAGGLLIQRLPGAPDEVIDTLQEKWTHFGSVASRLAEGTYIDQVMIEATNPYSISELDRQPVHFFCRCNRKRFLSALSMLSYEDLKEMKGENQEIVCHFCGNRIEVTASEINSLSEEAHARLN